MEIMLEENEEKSITIVIEQVSKFDLIQYNLAYGMKYKAAICFTFDLPVKANKKRPCSLLSICFYEESA